MALSIGGFKISGQIIHLRDQWAFSSTPPRWMAEMHLLVASQPFELVFPSSQCLYVGVSQVPFSPCHRGTKLNYRRQNNSIAIIVGIHFRFQSVSVDFLTAFDLHFLDQDWYLKFVRFLVPCCSWLSHSMERDGFL